jgi:membrane-associated protease RseP (regulator of RpoE activity)
MSLKRGIKVSEFSIGFGPAFYTKEKNNIIYKLCILPLGGYVKMPENPLVKGSEGKVFSKSKNKDKLLSILAGPLSNIVIGYFLLLIFMILSLKSNYIVVDGIADFFISSVEVFFKTIFLILQSFKDLLFGNYGVSDLSGPIGITKIISEEAKNSLASYIFIMSAISINIGVFNLLPIPALDGARALFVSLEALLKNKISMKVQEKIHFAGLVFLLSLIAVVSINDLFSFF